MKRAITKHFKRENRVYPSFFSGSFSSFSFFWSPRMVLTGQILNSGHFSQPTANATGQIVMTFTSFAKVTFMAWSNGVTGVYYYTSLIIGIVKKYRTT